MATDEKMYKQALLLRDKVIAFAHTVETKFGKE